MANPYKQYSMSQSNPTPGYTASDPRQTFKKHWQNFDIETEKKKSIDLFFNSRSVWEDFRFFLSIISSEPEDCTFRVNLFKYGVDKFILSNKNEFIKNTTSHFLMEFFDKSPMLEYLAILLQALQQVSKYTILQEQRATLTDLEKRLDKIRTEEDYYKVFRCDHVDRFIQWKKHNVNSEYSLCSKNQLYLIKQCTKAIYEGIIVEMMNYFNPDIILNILIRYLLVFSPLEILEEYNLVYRMQDTIAKYTHSPKSSYEEPRKFKSMMLILVDLLKLKYHPNDSFKGYRNLSIQLELLESNQIYEFVTSNMLELIEVIGTEKEDLGKLIYNMTMSSITASTCFFILSFAQSAQLNGMYEQLMYLFQHIVIPILMPKLKVQRSFHACLDICKFFFYGFSVIEFNLNTVLIGHMLQNISILNIGAQRGKNQEQRKMLNDYLNFLDCVTFLYEKYAQEKSWIHKVQQCVEDVRRENDLMLRPNDRTRLYKECQNEIWKISQDDLVNNIRPSVTDALLMKYKADSKYKGIKNVGNTCYLASTMQALFMTPEFSETLIDQIQQVQSVHKKLDIEKSNVLLETQNLFFSLKTSQQDAVDPLKLKQCLPPPFSTSAVEQDAQEYLQEYFDTIERFLINAKMPNLIDKLFAGYQIATTTCQVCNNKSTKKEKYLTFSLSFENHEQHYDQVEMIRNSFTPEEFENSIDCDKCKKKSKLMTKDTQIYSLPDYMIMTLNRFRFDGKQKSKVFSYVEVKSLLDFKDVLPENKNVQHNKYMLYAMVVHSGNSTERGHYYTFVRDPIKQDDWYILNDSKCYNFGKEVNFDSFFKQYENDTPYLLFYKTYTPY